MSAKCVNVKAFPRSSAKATIDYVHDQEHENHRDHTQILEDLTFKSEALNLVDGDWALIDNLEAALPSRTKDGGKCFGREYEIIYPEDANEEQIREINNQFLKDFCALSGMDEKKVLCEIVVHINEAYTDEKGHHHEKNPHGHALFCERELEFEKVLKTYSKDQWRDKDTNKMTKAGAPNSYLLAKKGDVIYKDGEPQYKNDGEPFLSAKNRELVYDSFLENLKKKTRDHYQILFPEHDFYVGTREDILPQERYTAAMERSHPDKAAAIKELNREIRQFNFDNGQDPEPQRRKNRVQEMKKTIKEHKKEGFNKSPEIQTSIFQSIQNLVIEAYKKIRQFLKLEKEKMKEPIELYSYKWGSNFGNHRGAIKYDPDEARLYFINADHQLQTFENIKVSNKDELINLLEYNGIQDISLLEKNANYDEYKPLLDEASRSLKSPEIAPEIKRGGGMRM